MSFREERSPGGHRREQIANRRLQSGTPRHRRLRAMCSVILLAATALTASVGGAAHVLTVIQKDRAFSVPTIAIERGDAIRFTNEDGFLHQMFAHSPTFSFDSDEQKPGEEVDVTFSSAGHFQVFCGIHPKMRLDVDVM